MNQLMNNQLIIVIALMGIFLVIGILIALSRLRGSSSTRNLWGQLGYRPVAGENRVSLGKQTSHFVRDYDGHQIHYLSQHKSGFGKMQMSVSWVCPLKESAQFGFQVVEAGLADHSIGAKVSKAIDQYKYDWQKVFSQSVDTDDPQIDSRFAIFSSHPQKTIPVIQDLTFKGALLSLKHVDLTVDESETRFDDPFHMNQWNVSGQALVDVHNKIALILTRAASAVS